MLKSFINLFKKNYVNYVSEIDRFFVTFDKKHTQKSKSQLLEIKKYQRVDFLRDHKDGGLRVSTR